MNPTIIDTTTIIVSYSCLINPINTATALITAMLDIYCVVTTKNYCSTKDEANYLHISWEEVHKITSYYF